MVKSTVCGPVAPGSNPSRALYFYLENINPTQRQPAAWGTSDATQDATRTHNGSCHHWLSAYHQAVMMNEWWSCVTTHCHRRPMSMKVYEGKWYPQIRWTIDKRWHVKRHSHMMKEKTTKVRWRDQSSYAGQYHYEPLSALSFPDIQGDTRKNPNMKCIKRYGNTYLQSRICFAIYPAPWVVNMLLLCQVALLYEHLTHVSFGKLTIDWLFQTPIILREADHPET